MPPRRMRSDFRSLSVRQIMTRVLRRSGSYFFPVRRYVQARCYGQRAASTTRSTRSRLLHGLTLQSPSSSPNPISRSVRSCSKNLDREYCTYGARGFTREIPLGTLILALFHLSIPLIIPNPTCFDSVSSNGLTVAVKKPLINAALASTTLQCYR